MSKFRNKLSNSQSLAQTILKGAAIAGVAGLAAAALFFSIEGIEGGHDDDDDEGGCESCTITITGTDSGAYTLSNGDVFCIQAGATFSGSVQRNSGSDDVWICNEGTISGASFSFNKGDNHFENNGTISSATIAFNNSSDENEFNNNVGASATFASLNFYTNDTEIRNYGTLNSGSFILSSGSEFRNYSGGTSTFGNTEINSNSDIRNDGTMTVNGYLHVNSNGEFNNNNSLTVNGDVEVNNDFSSDGTLHVTGDFDINNSAEVELEGSSIIDGTLTANKELDQDGDLSIGEDFIVNSSGRIKIHGDVVVGEDMTVGGDIEGKSTSGSEYGTIYIFGVTTLYGGGDLKKNLDVCDAGSPANGMDNRWGSVESSVTWCTNAAFSLPVEWLAFEATPGKNGVDLMWMTAVEENNDYFTIERSTDALQFEEVDQVKGQGNSSEPTMYEATDRQAPSGTLYYRIRQTDFDGRQSFSNQVEVQMETSSFSVGLYPNPATDVVNITIPSEGSSTGNIRIMTIQGQVVMNQSVALHSGHNEQQLQVGHLPAGNYLVQVFRGNGSQPQTVKMVKGR